MPMGLTSSLSWGLLVCGLSLSGSTARAARCGGRARLNAFERAQFIEVSFSSRAYIYAQYLSEPGCGKRVITELEKLGGKIEYSDVRSGYVLVTVPPNRVLDTLDVVGLAYAYARNDDRLYEQDRTVMIPALEGKAEPLPPIRIPYPRVATVEKPDGPYFTHDEIGLTELWKEHPEADGRGVRVAVLDEGFDLLHPAIQEARDTQGSPVPKVADLWTLTTPDEDSSWVRLDHTVVAAGGRFDAAGQVWVAPGNGTYRFGIFRQDLTLGPEGNSHTKNLTLSVGVLWSPGTNRIWVDTDGDRDFRNQRALRDYGTAHDIDWFGQRDSGGDNRIPFGVSIDPARDAVYVRVGQMHGTYVAGALAGNRLDGGLFDGAAPATQLIDANSSRATLLAAIVAMFARPDADVVSFSGGIGRAGFPSPDEGMEDFEQRVIERAIAVYDKPFAAYSAASGAIHVDDFAGAEMLRRNRQLGPPYKDTVNSAVWWVPNGAVNTVVSPSSNLETESRYMPIDIAWEDGERRSFGDDRFIPPAPTGYTIGDNNSPAIPVVSGILADLISEARREHVRYTGARLREALFTGARLLDGIPLSQQGYGLVDAAGAWEQLSRMAHADDPDNPQLTFFTFAQAKSGARAVVEGFQAELRKPGRTLDAEIWITRRGGYAAGRRYSFSLRGGDGSIELLDSERTLVRGRSARVRFRAKGVPGWHLVFLEMRDEEANAVMEDVPISVRVAEKPERMARGVDRYESTIAPLRSRYEYVDVGQDAQAVRYVMRIPYTGPESISSRFFPGFDYFARSQPPGEPVDPAHHIGPLETLESLVANSDSALKEVFWENQGRPEYATRHDGSAPDAPLRAEFEVHKYAIAIWRTSPRMLSVANRLAEVEGKVEEFNATVTSCRMRLPATHQIGEVESTLPAGLAEWRVRIGGDATAGRADAFLLDCTGKRGCTAAARATFAGGRALLVADTPKAGSWKVVVRPRGHVAVPHRIFRVTLARLVIARSTASRRDGSYASGQTWRSPVSSGSQYAAFRIKGTGGVNSEEQGLLIAVTPLAPNLP